MFGAVAPWIVAGIVGAFSGIAELISQFPPRRALVTRWSGIYILVNIGVAIFALFVYKVLHGPFPTDTPPQPVAWLGVVGIGLSGMALLRSTITVYLGSQPLQLSLSRVPQMILDSISREVREAQDEIVRREVGRIMRGLSFASSFESLPTYCIRQAGNQLTKAQANEIGNYVNNLRDDVMPDAAKAKLMGLYLVEFVGERALERAVNELFGSSDTDRR